MLLHEFYGQGDYQDRKAMVFKEKDGYVIIKSMACKEKDGYVVIMLEDKAICEERTITGHSEVYAENCAENWVLGVI